MTAPPTTPAAEHHDDGAHPHDGAARPGLPAWLVPAGLVLAIAGLLGGLLLGKGMSAEGAERVTDPVSLGFVRDMGTHHAQAVQMSEIAHRRSADPKLNYLAFDILSTQQGQIGIMSGWLELWRQSHSGSDDPMAWMGHTGPMPGMATEDEIAALNNLPVAEMEEQFLRLMIRHHRGAVPMADAAAAEATSPEVATFAGKMSAGQQSEVDLMQSMLVERGHAPEPESTTPARGGGHQAPAGPSPAGTSHDGH
jgi:uncharacterized protein (DUF305 family)